MKPPVPATGRAAPGAGSLPETRCTAAGPTAAGPTAARPIAAGPIAAGPTAARPIAAGPTAAGPIAAGLTAAGPTAAGPTAAGPTAAGLIAAGLIAAVLIDDGPAGAEAIDDEPNGRPDSPGPVGPVPVPTARCATTGVGAAGRCATSGRMRLVAGSVRFECRTDMGKAPSKGAGSTVGVAGAPPPSAWRCAATALASSELSVGAAAGSERGTGRPGAVSTRSGGGPAGSALARCTCGDPAGSAATRCTCGAPALGGPPVNAPAVAGCAVIGTVAPVAAAGAPCDGCSIAAIGTVNSDAGAVEPMVGASGEPVPPTSSPAVTGSAECRCTAVTSGDAGEGCDASPERPSGLATEVRGAPKPTGWAVTLSAARITVGTPGPIGDAGGRATGAARSVRCTADTERAACGAGGTRAGPLSCGTGASGAPNPSGRAVGASTVERCTAGNCRVAPSGGVAPAGGVQDGAVTVGAVTVGPVAVRPGAVGDEPVVCSVAAGGKSPSLVGSSAMDGEPSSGACDADAPSAGVDVCDGSAITGSIDRATGRLLSPPVSAGRRVTISCAGAVVSDIRCGAGDAAANRCTGRSVGQSAVSDVVASDENVGVGGGDDADSRVLSNAGAAADAGSHERVLGLSHASGLAGDGSAARTGAVDGAVATPVRAVGEIQDPSSRCTTVGRDADLLTTGRSAACEMVCGATGAARPSTSPPGPAGSTAWASGRRKLGFCAVASDPVKVSSGAMAAVAVTVGVSGAASRHAARCTTVEGGPGDGGAE